MVFVSDVFFRIMARNAFFHTEEESCAHEWLRKSFLSRADARTCERNTQRVDFNCSAREASRPSESMRVVSFDFDYHRSMFKKIKRIR